MKVIKIPCEHDLLSDDPEIWAEALVRCDGQYPYCGSDGFCQMGGNCFTDKELTREQAILEIDLLKQQLKESRHENMVLKTTCNGLLERLELVEHQNEKKGFSERVFAIRYCIVEVKRMLDMFK